MKNAIGYLRVSTREQGRSGLGLAAQRHDIETFGSREGFSVKSWYQDIQTGAGKDALLMRSGLAASARNARSGMLDGCTGCAPPHKRREKAAECLRRQSLGSPPGSLGYRGP